MFSTWGNLIQCFKKLFANKSAGASAIKSKNILNQQLGEELHKAIAIKNKKT